MIAAAAAINRGPGRRKSRITPAASQGTQAIVAVTGNSAQEKRPPPREKPAAASSDEARLRPVSAGEQPGPLKGDEQLEHEPGQQVMLDGDGARRHLQRGEGAGLGVRPRGAPPFERVGPEGEAPVRRGRAGPPAPRGGSGRRCR